METEGRPAKRQKPNPSEAKEKTKGRPSAGQKDESAVQRRRAQIRIAQRAYRQRKESTIDELRTQVVELSAKLESMSKAFHVFSNKANTRSLPWDLKSSFDELAALFSAGEVEAEQAEQVDISRGESASSSCHDRITQTLNAVDMQQVVIQNRLETGTLRRASPEPIPIALGYSMIFESPATKAPETHGSTTEDDSSASVATSQSTDATTPPDETNGTVSSLSFYSPKFVYSVDEWSFGRRIQRRCLEIGFQLLSHPHRAPHYYRHVFQVPICLGRSHAETREHFQIGLLKAVTDDLDSDDSPCNDIGGSGTHFASAHRAIRSLPAKRPAAVTALIAAAPSLEGEWFDAGDVEGYLASRGIHINPRSSYVEVSLPTSLLSQPVGAEFISATEANHVDAALEEYETYHVRKARGTPVHGPSPHQQHQQQMHSSVGANVTQMLFPNVGYSSDASTGSFLNFDFGFHGDGTNGLGHVGAGADAAAAAAGFAAFGPAPETMVPVTLDVAKLVRNLTLNALCLGRGPGFRRADVDRALRASVLAVF